jgi:hypothetical protein
LYKWALRVVERCVLSAAPGQPKGKKKHHDIIRDMIAASSHVLSSISSGGAQWVYGGSRLFVASARTKSVLTVNFEGSHAHVGRNNSSSKPLNIS